MTTTPSPADNDDGAGVRLDELVVEFDAPGGAIRPIDGLTAAIPQGALAVLNGPSGSGKTTLLSVLAGMLTPTSGRATVNGHDVSALSGAALEVFRRSTIGIVFQAFNLMESLTAAENVAMPLVLAGERRRSAIVTAAELLDRVGLADRLSHRPSALSGGQQQRVAIARALVADPPVILADEPTANLDPRSAERVIELLRGLSEDGTTVVISTHDQRLLPLAASVVDMVTAEDAHCMPGELLHISDDQILFETGDPSTVIYWVEEGTVSVERSGEQIALLGAGKYVGELGPMLGLERSATVRAAGDVVVRPVTVAEFRRERLARLR